MHSNHILIRFCIIVGRTPLPSICFHKNLYIHHLFLIKREKKSTMFVEKMKHPTLCPIFHSYFALFIEHHKNSCLNKPLEPILQLKIKRKIQKKNLQYQLGIL